MINEMNLTAARRIKAERQKRFADVLKKEKFETWGEVYDFIMGLTKNQQLTLAGRAVLFGGLTPIELKESLEKKKVKHEG